MPVEKRDFIGGAVNLSSLGILGVLLKDDYSKLQTILEIANQLTDLARDSQANIEAIKQGVFRLQELSSSLVDSVNILATAVVALITTLSNPFTRLLGVLKK